MARFDPSAATKDSDPSSRSDVSAVSAIAASSGTLSRAADHAGLIRRRRQHGPYAVDQHRRDPGAAAEIAHHLRHPVEIDAGENERMRVGVDGRYRIGGDHRRLVGGLGEQKIAEDDIATAGCFLQVGPVAQIHTDQRVVGRALNSAIAVGDQEVVNPWQIVRQACAQQIAAAADAAAEARM